MSETTGSAIGFFQHFNRFPSNMFMPGNNHLANTLTVLNHKLFVRQVDQDNPNFATIVGIDCSRRIQNGNSLLLGQPTSWTNLSFETYR